MVPPVTVRDATPEEAPELSAIALATRRAWGYAAAVLAHLWVLPGYWRQGLGRRRLADALDEATREGARRVGEAPAPTSADPARVLPRPWLDAKPR